MRPIVLVIAVACLLIESAPSAAEGSFQIIQITNNDTQDDNPDVSGSNVVWNCEDFQRVCLWDATTITELASNTGIPSDPHVSGSNVVWRYVLGVARLDPDPISAEGLRVHQPRRTFRWRLPTRSAT